jgi:hypothetical protein
MSFFECSPINDISYEMEKSFYGHDLHLLYLTVQMSFFECSPINDISYEMEKSFYGHDLHLLYLTVL